MDPKKKLSSTIEQTQENTKHYQRLTSKLIYLSHAVLTLHTLLALSAIQIQKSEAKLSENLIQTQKNFIGFWIRIQRLLNKLGLNKEESINVFSDSQPAICIAKSLVHQDRTKHIEIDQHFISKRLTSELLISAMFLLVSKLLIF